MKKQYNMVTDEQIRFNDEVGMRFELNCQGEDLRIGRERHRALFSKKMARTLVKYVMAWIEFGSFASIIEPQTHDEHAMPGGIGI